MKFIRFKCHRCFVIGNGLFLPQLEALAKMVPTKEEEDKLSSYKGDINELGSAEKFVMAMLKVPFAFLRIEAMLYRETFDDEVHLLKKSFSMLEVTSIKKVTFLTFHLIKMTEV